MTFRTKSLSTGLFMVLCFQVLFAQKQITGLVTDELGTPLLGVNVLERGTANGVVTDFDGNFSITVAGEGSVLRFSYVGFKSRRLTIGGSDYYEVQLKLDSQLDEVVVTALGVRRAEKALGYSVQKLSTQEVAEVKATNFTDNLAGKVAGVFITGSSAGPTASSNINIRGAASLLGNNQPLFVVNGMPITNDLFSFDDGLNGSTTIDFGNAAQNINPDDIASVNILKGPAASALYGARAADGVILVETKTGEGAKGLGIEFNNSTLFSSILKMPDFQNEYGFGGGGKYSYLDGSNYIGANEYYEAYGENWGPRMNGQLIKQFNSNGEPVPFTPAPDNVRDFYRMGITTINNISINHYDDESDMRFSYTRLDREDILPNTDLRRNTYQLSLGRRMLDNKLSFRANAIYVNSFSGNVPNAGYDESSSVQYGWLWYPRQVDINDLRDYWIPGQEGVQQRYVENLWVNNPWFIINENTNSFRNNRLIGNIEINYEIDPRLSLRLKYGGDVLSERRQYRRAPSTKAVLLGSYREDEITFSETNAEALLSYSTDRTNGRAFQLDLKVGGNIMRQRANFLVANNPQLKLFGTDNSIYTLANNRSGVLTESQKTRVGINSLFGLATLSYKNYLYLDLSARNDWSSTLVDPEAGVDGSNYDFFYPSASVSAILSDMFDLQSNTISFWKLKGNYAEVGNGAPPYAFGTTFTPQAAFGGNTVFTANRTVTDPNLTNERTRAFEVGTDIRFFNNRFRLDATYYNMLSFDQVIRLPVASTSGYDFTLTNGGSIRNQGVEVLMSIIPIQNPDFEWSTTINLGHNRAVVESLPDVISSGRYSIVADLFPGDEGGSDLEFVAVEGQEFGQLYGLGFVRHPETGEIIHQNGLPMMTQDKVSAGSYQPDVRAGIENTFRYKNIDFSFLFDGQFGGKIYSRSHALYNTGGTITNNDDPNLPLSTLDGRTTYSVDYDASGEPVYTLDEFGGGVVGPGLNWTDTNGDGQIDYDSELSPNTVRVEPGGVGYVGYFYTYYGNGFNRDNIEAATYDATYVKLREVSLGYNVPESFCKKLGMQSARFSLIGRNLLLFTDVPTIDPETFSVRNGVFVPGFESQQIFPQRSYGFAINLSF